MAAEIQPDNSESIVQRITDELRAHPEARAVLLRTLLSEDLITLPAQYDRIAEGVAANTEAISRLAVRMDQLTERVDQLGKRMDQLTERVDQLGKRMDQLTERVDQLTVTVGDLVAGQKQMQIDIGDLKGWGLELLSSRRLPAYAKVMQMRRLAEIDHASLLEMAEQACEKGTITDDEMYHVASADACFRGWSRRTGADAYLVAQISYAVDPNDVQRAVEQAELLARITGEQAFPVVAGTFLTPRGEATAQDLGRVPFVRLTDGRRLQA